MRQDKRDIESFRDEKDPETWLFSFFLRLKLDVGYSEMLDHQWVICEEKAQNGAERCYGWPPSQGPAWKARFSFGNMFRDSLRRSRDEKDYIRIQSDKICRGRIHIGLIYHCVPFIVVPSFLWIVFLLWELVREADSGPFLKSTESRALGMESCNLCLLGSPGHSEPCFWRGSQPVQELYSVFPLLL